MDLNYDFIEHANKMYSDDKLMCAAIRGIGCFPKKVLLDVYVKYTQNPLNSWL